MTAPRPGDRVRVVIEGEARALNSTAWKPDEFIVGDDGDTPNVISPSAAHVVSVEVLPPPEPQWEVGDVVLAANGAVYSRFPEGRWYGFAGGPYESDLPQAVRPLTLLVRDGKPVGGE